MTHPVRTAAPALLLLALAGCKSSTGNGFDFERMVQQVNFHAYEGTTLFPDGKVMREPPDGTVPHQESRPSEVVRIGEAGGEPVDAIPVPVTARLLQRGQDRFDVYCTPCHGYDGLAGTPVAQAMPLKPPPSLHADFIVTMPDGMLYQIVKDGYGLMPGYDYQLPVEDRWAVVAYVRALELSQRTPLDVLPPAQRDSALQRLPSPGAGR